VIVVHHLNNSRSQRVLWLLEELGLPYEVKRYERDAKTMLAPPELRQVHPLGKSPVITDGEITVAESGAILEYLVDKTDGRLRPAAGTPAHRRYTYWMHFAEGSAMPPLLLSLIFGKIPTMPMPFFARPIARAISNGVKARMIEPNLRNQLAYMESELAQREWFAGDEMTAADVQMSFPLEAAAQRAGLTAATHPRLIAFLARIHARPAYRAALERGGPYALMG